MHLGLMHGSSKLGDSSMLMHDPLHAHLSGVRASFALLAVPSACHIIRQAAAPVVALLIPVCCSVRKVPTTTCKIALRSPANAGSAHPY